MGKTTHDMICDYFQLDPAHYEHMKIEPILPVGCYRITWLNGNVEDYMFDFAAGRVIGHLGFNDNPNY